MQVNTCTHANTVTQAGVNQIIDPKTGKLKGYQFNASVKCSDCQMPFHFPNLPICLDIARVPSAINNGTMLIIPLQAGTAQQELN